MAANYNLADEWENCNISLTEETQPGATQSSEITSNDAIEYGRHVVPWAVRTITTVYGQVVGDRLKTHLTERWGEQLEFLGRWVSTHDSTDNDYSISDLWSLEGGNFDIWIQQNVQYGQFVDLLDTWEQEATIDENSRQMSLLVGDIFGEAAESWFNLLLTEYLGWGADQFTTILDLLTFVRGPVSDWPTMAVDLRARRHHRREDVNNNE